MIVPCAASLVLLAPLFAVQDARESAFAGESPSARDRGWQSDLDFFVTRAKETHAGPARPAFSAEFDQAAANLRAAVPELSDDELLLRLMRLSAVLNDGHTGVFGPGPDTPLDFERGALPFKLYRFPDGVYIVDGHEEWADWAGSRIERIGSVSAEDALDRMAAYRGVDNSMMWNWIIPQFYAGRLVLLRAVGAAPATGDTVELTLVTPNGTRETLDVPCGEFEFRRKLRPSPAAMGDVPLWLSNVDTNFWMEPLPDEDALFVQFNQVRDMPLESIASFADELRETLLMDGVKNLIVDVRHNNGGNNTLLRPLVRTLVEFDMRAPDNRVLVLMGRNTFSAAQNFLNRVERWVDAEFLGEPSSSCPNFTGESNDFELPFSKIRGSISNLHWQDSDPWDSRPWIEPDVAVDLTARDYFDGVDPVLEAALDLTQR